MGSIYALLVGVDEYRPGVATPLGGCRNDIAEARRLLQERASGGLSVRTLLDGEATRAAVEEAVRGHLGRAGAGDTALLWFSGHGTQSLAETAEDLRIEATGRNQALVCHDGLLPDKRLARLLDGLAEGGGHVAVVLDCCFSGGATREATGTARYAPPPPGWDGDDTVDRRGTGDTPGPGDTRGPDGAGGSRAVPDVPGAPRHVLLAASRLNQVSFEDDFEGRRHGAFTHALLGAVRDSAPTATYRELLAAADARLQRAGGRQQPVLYPAHPGSLADTPFLGGAAARPPAPYLLRFGVHGWEVDCGAVHGLTEHQDPGGTVFTVVPEDGAVQVTPPVVRARAVHAAHTLVEPVDWTPSRTRVYPVALSALPRPPATVTVDASGPGDAGRLGAVRAAIAGAPLLRLLDDPRQAGGLHFRVRVEDGHARVLRRDGTPFTGPVPLDGAYGPEEVATCLSHLTRWHQIRDLSPGPSPLDGLVRVEISPWDAPEDALLHPDGSGEIVCPYTTGSGDEPQAPWLSIRLRNRSQTRALWCVLVVLGEDHSARTVLYPGHFIGPGHTGHALDGDPVRLSLPPDRPAVPGASARDWLKLIVSESELNTVPFTLPPWEPSMGGRPVGPVDTPKGRWTARTAALRTVVPTGPGA